MSGKLTYLGAGVVVGALLVNGWRHYFPSEPTLIQLGPDKSGDFYAALISTFQCLAREDQAEATP